MSDDRAGRAPPAPRTHGTARLSVKRRDGRSVVAGLETSGASRILFPVSSGRLDATVINTAGGLTGGDRMALEADVAAGATLAVTTQAAERAYRAAGGTARVASRLHVGADGTLLWLPQELILFEGAAMQRRLAVDLAPGARLLAVEAVIFGRAAMGEVLRDAAFADRVEITREGHPIYRDAIRFSGDVRARMERAATGRGAGAMASVVHVGPDAEALLAPIRAMLPASAGTTLLRSGLLALRMLAQDGFELRRHLIPVLDLLSRDTLPASWRL